MEQKKDDIKNAQERMDSESNTHSKVEQKNPKDERSSYADKVVVSDSSKTSTSPQTSNKNPTSTPTPQH